MTSAATDPHQLVGTAQHPRAKDLSSYLIHMTRTPADLASILVDGCIEARGAFGLAGQDPSRSDSHRCVCLTETPAQEIERFASKRKYGIVFKRAFIIRLGGQRVWYVNYATPAFEALKHEMNRLHNAEVSSRFLELTPYIDMWREDVYAFDWEREWRVNGDVRFEWSDVEYLITENQGLLTVLESPDVGSGYFHPKQQDYIWTGGTLPELDAAVGALAEQFTKEFAEPDEALFHDSEQVDGYAWGGIRHWETREAIESINLGRPRAVIDALEAHLNERSVSWLSRKGLA